jgi:hypothetical protein
MKFLLRLKHWQLFVLTWGVPIAINIYSFVDPTIIFRLFPAMMFVFMVMVFGWIWSVCNVLHKKLPPGVDLNLLQFQLMFSIPIVYCLFILGWINFANFTGEYGSGQSMGVTLTITIIIMHLVSIACILLGVRFAAKTLKSIELGRLAKFGDYAGEFFLIWFSPLGIWILQPRLNRLTKGPDNQLAG